MVIINCWLLSLVLRCYLSKEGTWKSLSGDVKLLSYGLLNVLIRPVSSEHHWEHVPSDNQSRLPELWLKGWRKRGEGRRGEQRKWLWGGQGHHQNNALLCFISLMKLPHFRLYRKTLAFPLCIDVGHCFLPSIHVLYSKGTLMLAQMLAEGSFSRPELGRKMTQHLRRHLRSEVPMSFDMWVLYKECFCILGNYQSRI